jgi:CCT motif
MFTNNGDSNYASELDYENPSTELYYTFHRKDSFVDLLSYNKRITDPDLEDLLDLEVLTNDFSNPEAQTNFSPIEPMQLLLDELPDFNVNHNCISDIQTSLKIPTAIKKYDINHIGTLSVQERTKKIQKYLEKKKKRTWKKRIHYDCRKKVADSRLRIKGRFVTRNKVMPCIIDPDLSKIETKIN